MTEKCNLKLERLALAMLGMKKIMTRNMLLKMNWKKQERDGYAILKQIRKKEKWSIYDL